MTALERIKEIHKAVDKVQVDGFKFRVDEPITLLLKAFHVMREIALPLNKLADDDSFVDDKFEERMKAKE